MVNVVNETQKEQRAQYAILENITLDRCTVRKVAVKFNFLVPASEVASKP
jgi:hypothetical protein